MSKQAKRYYRPYLDLTEVETSEVESFFTEFPQFHPGRQFKEWILKSLREERKHRREKATK